MGAGAGPKGEDQKTMAEAETTEEKAPQICDDTTDAGSLLSSQSSVDKPKVEEGEKKIADPVPDHSVTMVEPSNKTKQKKPEEAQSSAATISADASGPAVFTFAHIPPVLVVLLIVLL